MKKHNSDVALQQKVDLDCAYLHASLTNMLLFFSDYNSGEYGRAGLSFLHLYKAWDALYQSVLLHAGRRVREFPKGDQTGTAATEDAVLGKVYGITEHILNPQLKHSNTLHLAIPEMQHWVDNIADARILHEDPLYNSLDVLRRLRNAVAHDFLEEAGGSYASLVLDTNPFVIPLVASYVRIVSGCSKGCPGHPGQQVACRTEGYLQKIIQHCIEQESGEHDGSINRHGGRHCAKRTLKQKEYSTLLPDRAVFPAPVLHRVGYVEERSGSVTHLYKKWKQEMMKRPGGILLESDWDESLSLMHWVKDGIQERYPYSNHAALEEDFDFPPGTVTAFLEGSYDKEERTSKAHQKQRARPPAPNRRSKLKYILAVKTLSVRGGKKTTKVVKLYSRELGYDIRQAKAWKNTGADAQESE